MHCAVQEKRVLIVDDHPVVAFSIALLLSKIDSGISAPICGCADTAREEFLRPVEWFRIFVDLDVPKSDGLSLVRYFAQQRHQFGAGQTTLRENFRLREVPAFEPFIKQPEAVAVPHQQLGSVHFPPMRISSKLQR
jgi:CheY-like chemotaxis protein